MNGIKRVVLFSIIGLFVLQISCSDNSVTTEIKPGRRDYTWEIDTIPNYCYMSKLWGSSPTDVWAIGQPGDFSKSIYHFDGQDWTTDNVTRLLVPHSIYGFAWNDIWIGGSDGRIWHYDGNSWSHFTSLSKDGNTNIVFDNMWGESGNDLYAFGAYPEENGAANNSIVSHFTNNRWEILDTEGIVGIVERYYKNRTDGEIFLQTYKIGLGEYPDSTLIFNYSNNKYKRIYGNYWAQGYQSDLSLIDGSVFFILGYEIAKRVGNEFETFLLVENSNFYQRLWGRNVKDIFLLMTDGLVHYNGTDMEYLLYFSKPRTQIYSAMLFEKEVFFLVDESQTGLYLIYHGKLNGG